MRFLFKKQSEWTARFSTELKGTIPSSIDDGDFFDAVSQVFDDMGMSTAFNMTSVKDRFSLFLYNDDGLRSEEFMSQLRLYLEEPSMSCHQDSVRTEMNPFVS